MTVESALRALLDAANAERGVELSRAEEWLGGASSASFVSDLLDAGAFVPLRAVGPVPARLVPTIDAPAVLRRMLGDREADTLGFLPSAWSRRPGWREDAFPIHRAPPAPPPELVRFVEVEGPRRTYEDIPDLDRWNDLHEVMKSHAETGWHRISEGPSFTDFDRRMDRQAEQDIAPGGRLAHLCREVDGELRIGAAPLEHWLTDVAFARTMRAMAGRVVEGGLFEVILFACTQGWWPIGIRGEYPRAQLAVVRE